MYNCVFALNDRPMSTFRIGALSVPAFSGLGSYVNKRSAACLANLGPIPPGSYFVLDRRQGGLLAPLRTLLRRDESRWFALYRIDEKIDDETFCDRVRRGEFRLHPKGALGISKGCVVIDKMADFLTIEALLRGTSSIPVPGTTDQAHGVLVVSW
jgi:hypothetical protein